MDTTLALAAGFKKLNLFYGLNTNLSFLDQERLGKVQEVTQGSKFGILTSLPHFETEIYKKITGADDLDDFYKNLEYLVKTTNIPITVNMVIHQLNKNDVYEEGKYLFERFGLKNFAATPILAPPYRNCKDKELNRDEIKAIMSALVKLNEDFNINIDSLETIPRCLVSEEIKAKGLETFNRACSAGRSTLSVGYDGSVRACSHAPFSAGNIFEDGFAKIWASFKPFRENSYVPNDCKDCADFYGCHGGCRVYGYQKGSALNGKDPRMTQPVSERKAREKNMPELETDKAYIINPKAIFRMERDGLYTFFNGNFSDVLFVNSQFKEFIERLKGRGRFRMQDLNMGEGNRDKAERMVRLLLDKKYLI